MKFGTDTKPSMEKSKISFPTTKNDDVTSHLATVAMDEKNRFPKSNYTVIWHLRQD